MTPRNTTASPRTKRVVTRRKTALRYDARPVSPQAALTGAEVSATVQNDASQPQRSNAELAAMFEGRKPSEIDYRVDVRIRISRLRDKIKALDEGFPFE